MQNVKMCVLTVALLGVWVSLFIPASSFFTKEGHEKRQKSFGFHPASPKSHYPREAIQDNPFDLDHHNERYGQHSYPLDHHRAPYQPYTHSSEPHYPYYYFPQRYYHPEPLYPEPLHPPVFHPAPFHPEPFHPIPEPYIHHVPSPTHHRGPPLEDKEFECEWRVVFKAVAGNGRNVYNDFKTAENMNTKVPGANELANPLTYRNGYILDYWEHLIVSKVKVEVFVHGILGTWFIFDGLGSTFTDWFSQDRLLASPYHDMKTGTFNFFSMEGDTTEQTSFLINHKYADECQGDCGYLAVVDDPESTCSWKCVGASPLFVFNTRVEECGVFNEPTQVHYGDRLVISVKQCHRNPVW